MVPVSFREKRDPHHCRSRLPCSHAPLSVDTWTEEPQRGRVISLRFCENWRVQGRDTCCLDFQKDAARPYGPQRLGGVWKGSIERRVARERYYLPTGTDRPVWTQSRRERPVLLPTESEETERCAVRSCTLLTLRRPFAPRPFPDFVQGYIAYKKTPLPKTLF